MDGRLLDPRQATPARYGTVASGKAALTTRWRHVGGHDIPEVLAGWGEIGQTGLVTASSQDTVRRVQPSGDALDLSAAVITAGLLGLLYAGVSNPPTALVVLRLLLTLAFAFFVPGRAIISNWPRLAGWSEVAMSMVFSLAVLTLLATAMLWAHFWHPLGLFQVEAWLTVAGLCVGMERRRTRVRPDARRPRSGPPGDG